MQVPTSIINKFEFGILLTAPTAKAILSLPKVVGDLYKTLIGRGVDLFNKMKFLFKNKVSKLDLCFTVESINLSHLGINFFTKFKSMLLYFETNISLSNKS